MIARTCDEGPTRCLPPSTREGILTCLYDSDYFSYLFHLTDKKNYIFPRNRASALSARKTNTPLTPPQSLPRSVIERGVSKGQHHQTKRASYPTDTGYHTPLERFSRARI